MDDTANTFIPAVKFTPDQRSTFRRAIVGHEKWKAWRLRNNASIADMSINDMIRCAIELGIDPLDYGTAANAFRGKRKSYGNDSWTGQPKPRPYGEDVFYQLQAQFQTLKPLMSEPDRDFAAAILETVQAKQDRCLTEGQHAALCRVFARYDNNKANADTTTTHANKESTMFDATPTAATITTTTSVPTNDAASQLATLLAQMAGQAMNPEAVARIVDERITKALAGIPSVKFEVKGWDGETRDVTGHKHPKFGALLRAATSRMSNGYAPNVWIAGPTGSGKTHACTMLADAMGLPFHIHGATDMAHELLGFIDAAGTYHRTPFREAFEHGGVVVMDEIDAWGHGAYLALNSMTSNAVGTFPDGKVTRHANCVIVACANTWGLGATADYVGRTKIDAAFLSRFAIRIQWQYDTALEIAISGNEAWANRVIAARNRAKASGLKVVICPRVTLSGSALIANGASPDEAAELTYLANVTPEQAKVIESR